MKRFAVATSRTLMGTSLVLGLSLALAAPAHAQAAAGKGPERRVVINLDEEVIEGRLDVPDPVMVVRPTAHKFRSLIQVRTDFRKEVLASSARL